MKVFTCCTSLWSMALLGGFYCLANYEATPGAVMPHADQWPADATIARTPGRFALVMAAHPRCPCTRASIAELGRILARSKAPTDVQILFFKPRDSAWAPTELWRQAEALPGARVSWDDEGLEAARFGAHTSGHTLLFDRDGRLLFSGGVTNGRGHSGPSQGNLAIAAWLTPGESGVNNALVFGCSLTDPQSICTQGNKACQHRQSVAK